MNDSIPNWKPSALLAQATIVALTSLSRQWPKAMALALDSSEAGREYMADYAYAMKGADLRAIPLAARAWVGENSMPPKPADLGKLAREITREQFPTTYRDIQQLRPTSTERQDTSELKNGDRITVLGHRAHKVLGTWRRVGEVWGLLFQTAPTDDHREAVRRGDVPYDVFDEAVDSIRRGIRATPGPLADALSGARL